MGNEEFTLPVRPDDGNKGTFGTVAVVGGCETYLGAPLLSGRAAYCAGCGLVELVVPEVVRNCGAAAFPEAIWNCAAFEAGAVPARKNSVTVIGPGLGQSNAAAERLPGFLASASAHSRALVLDADALNLLSRDPLWYEKLTVPCVLTPHPGEMSRLCGLSIAEIQANREAVAQTYAAKWGQVLLLKGANTVIAAPEEGKFQVLPYRTSALAKAGSGDVLSGIIAGLIAQGMTPYGAAVIGAGLHARAGMLAAQVCFSCRPVMASDILTHLPEAVAELEQS